MNGLAGLGSPVLLATFLAPLGAIIAGAIVAYGYWAKKMHVALPVALVLWIAPWLLAFMERDGMRDLIEIGFHPNDNPLIGPLWIAPIIGVAIAIAAVTYRLRARG